MAVLFVPAGLLAGLVLNVLALFRYRGGRWHILVLGLLPQPKLEFQWLCLLDRFRIGGDARSGNGKMSRLRPISCHTRQAWLRLRQDHAHHGLDARFRRAAGTLTAWRGIVIRLWRLTAATAYEVGPASLPEPVVERAL
jgi:hypothetical protein